MKQLTLLFSALLLCSSLFFTSCKKDKPDNTKPGEITPERIVFTNLTNDELYIKIGDSFEVEYAILPKEADQDIVLEWYSEDEDIATISNGVVEGISIGNTYIYATYEDIEALFFVSVSEGGNVLLQEDFNDGIPSDWENIDADGDGFFWGTSDDIAGGNNGINGTECVMSQSYDNTRGALTPDNYLISPQITIPNTGYKLSWYTLATDYDWYQEHYTVYVREGNNDTEIFSETMTTADFNYNEVDLSAFFGKNVKIVFRHHDVTDQFNMGLDNIAVANCEVEWSDPELTCLIQEDFNDGIPSNWENIDADGDGFFWGTSEEITDAICGINGTECVMSQSYTNSTDSPLTPDNYLISPQITIPNTGYKLSWYTLATDYDWYQEHYTVYVREGNNDTEIFSETMTTADFNYNEVDLSAFFGKNVKIVFRHHDVTDQFNMGLDNIAVANCEVEWSDPLPTYLIKENFNNGNFQKDRKH